MSVVAVVFCPRTQIGRGRAVVQLCPVAGRGHGVHNAVEKPSVFHLIAAHHSGLGQVNDLHLRCVDPADHAGHHKFHFSSAGPKIRGVSAIVSVCVAEGSCTVLRILCDRIVLCVKVYHLD